LLASVTDKIDGDIEGEVLFLNLVPHSVHPLARLTHRIGIAWFALHQLGDNIIEFVIAR
jgi:hypothetical protein